MNIDVIARVERGQGSGTNLNTTANEVSEPNGANRIRIQNVYEEGNSNNEIYKTNCAPLVDLQVAGYNVSTIVLGSAQAGQASLVQGTDNNGLFHRYLEGLFTKLDDERSIAREAQSSLGARKEASITVSVLQMLGESVMDLITSRTNLKIEEDAEHGEWFRAATQRRIYSASEGSQLFAECWQRCVYSNPSPNNHTIYAYIDLTTHFEDAPEPHRSRYSCVILPPVDGLVESTDNSTEIKAVAKLISDFAAHQHPDRVVNHKATMLTRLLDDELGGNCTTKVIALFNKSAELRVQRELLTMCKNVQKVNNFPIMNDAFAQQLLTQYRAAVLHHRKQPIRQPTPQVQPAPAQVRYSNSAMEPLRLENQRLLDQVERLQLKIEQLNTKFGSLAAAKSELSAQLVDCEEEKLRATKAYIDMQIQNNRLREEMESSKYELTNKILTLEHEYQLSEIERQKLSKESANLRHQLKQLEADRKSLADEYIKLKSSYMSLTDDVQREVARNDELTMELLNLLNARSVLAREKEPKRYEEEAAAMGREEQRIRSLLHKLSHNPDAVNRLRPDRRKTDFLEKEIFGNQSRYQEQLDRMRNDYSDSNQQLQQKMESMEKELSAIRQLARERQQKISFLNAKLITTAGENAELKTVNNRLQHKIKDINAEYRLRLTKYVEDISSHIDSLGKDQAEESLAQYVNKMIKDVKSAHRNREDQLSQAAQSYKHRLEQVVRRHEELLCAYRDLRAQVELLGRDDLDLGPDEHEMVITDAELQSAQQKEMVRLQSEIHNLRINNKRSEEQIGNPAPPGILKKLQNRPPVDSTFSNLDSWTSVRKELRNFSEQSLRELEEERATLMSKNVILEEQLKESQDYIDKHLARYKEEINRLRQQLAYHKNRS